MEENTEEIIDTNPAAGETAAEANAPIVEGNEEAAEVFVPDDSTLERAVKAGLSLADARAFTSKEMADRLIGMLEAKSNGSGDGATKADGGEEIPAIDFGSVSEENGYDPALVKVMNSMKSVIESQAKTIATMKAGATAKRTQANIDSRRNLTLARPGGESGKRGSGMSAEDEVLTALRSKFKLT